MHAGVLRTEVHPTAGRVAVVGDVDAGRLVKRLAKVGKIAEVIVVAQPSPEVERRRRDVGGSKKEASPDNGKMGGGTAPKHGGADDDKRGETNGGAGSGASSARIHGGGDDDVKAAMCCYHRAEPPAMAVPVLQPPYNAAAAAAGGGVRFWWLLPRDSFAGDGAVPPRPYSGGPAAADPVRRRVLHVRRRRHRRLPRHVKITSVHRIFFFFNLLSGSTNGEH